MGIQKTILFVLTFMLVLLPYVLRVGKLNDFLSAAMMNFYLFIYGQYIRLLPI